MAPLKDHCVGGQQKAQGVQANPEERDYLDGAVAVCRGEVAA